MKGRVKWFDIKKGFGFIQRSDGGDDVFIHVTSIRNQDHRELAENDQVEFEIVQGNKGEKAWNVVRL
jgi:cold shock protein